MGVQFAGNILVQSNGGPLPISAGGTGQTTAPTAINALLPVQTGNAGRLLSTDGTNVTWQAAVMTPGGADTMIQFNDSGSFGGSANFVINKSTGALTSLSTFSGTGLAVSDAVATTRALKFQTAGSDRWLLQANNVNETGSNVGSNFEFVRVADNGATSNQVFTVSRLSGVVDFKVAPTVNGGAIGGVTSFNTRVGAITLTSADVTTALTFTPYDATNPDNFISGITSSDVTTALGFTPYNATNPNGYTTNTGTVTSVAGAGTVSGLTLTGTVTTTGSLTLGGTLSLTSGQITTGLGFTPVNKAGDTMTGALTATGFVGPLTGNASTATALATPRAINGVNFDGTAPITVTAAAGTLTGTTLNSAVVSSSLTSVGTLATLTVTAPITGSVTGNAGTVTNGVYTTDTGTVTNAMLAGSITNAKLVNSSTTIGTTAIALGASSTTLAGLTSVTSTGFTGALTGNASTATTLATARNISASGDAAWTVSFNGSADATAALTLTTVNASPVTASFQKITTNGKGLVTATTAVVASDITTALAYTPVNKAGDTMTGALILNANPTNALGAATKQYVDDIASGVNVHAACETGTTAALASSTYNNGASGVGATLTATANASINTAGVGGYTTLTVGSRILVKNQVTQTQNGIYTVSDLGSVSTPWILVRATDFDGAPTTEIVAGDLTYVQEGTLAGTQWVETAVGTGHNTTPSYDYIIIGTDNIVFSQFAGAGSYTAGTGINIASNAISNTGVLSNVAGTGISVSGATGNVTVTNTGVLSITGTANQVIASASTGAVTLSLPQSINSGAAPTFAGTNFTSIPNGALTNSSVTVNGTAIALGASGTVTAAAGTLTGATLASGVTASSLTSLGTLSSLAVTGSTTFSSTVGVGGGLSLTATNAGIEIGSTSVSNTPFIDFHSSGNAVDYDTRIIANGGTSTNGQGSLQIIGAGGVSLSNSLSVAGQTTINTGSTSGNGSLIVADTGVNGGNIKITGNGATTPSKYLRVNSGVFQIINDGYTTNLLSLTDAGALSVPGSVTGASLTTTGTVVVNGIGTVGTATLTTSTTTAGQVVASVAIAAIRSATYTITVTSGSAYEYTEVRMIHDGTNVYLTETNTILTGAALATFTADISGGNMRLLTTPTNAVTVYKVVSVQVAV